MGDRCPTGNPADLSVEDDGGMKDQRSNFGRFQTRKDSKKKEGKNNFPLKITREVLHSGRFETAVVLLVRLLGITTGRLESRLAED